MNVKLQKALSKIRSLTQTAHSAGNNIWSTASSIEMLDDSTFLDFAYQFIFRRLPDGAGKRHYLDEMSTGRITRDSLIETFLNSKEFQLRKITNMTTSIHASRIQWVKHLPRANTILDLGGTSKGDKQGALLSMGYPYKFEKLFIVDLPLDLRHPLYSEGYEKVDTLESLSGTVRYVYTSMTDLSQFNDSSVDLINCGQSIEHVTESDAEIVFKESMRILKSGKYLCLDTPNSKATRLQQKGFIDPDHKYEYRHEELSKKLSDAGFKLIESKGLNYLPASFEKKRFDESEVIRNVGIFDDIDNCYILAYRCQKPVKI